MVGNLRGEVQHLLESHQFVYKDTKGIDDALDTTTHFILKHLENPSAYARLMFMDLSSAFQTILPPTLLNKLKQTDLKTLYKIR